MKTTIIFSIFVLFNLVSFSQSVFKRDIYFSSKNYHLGELNNSYIFFPSAMFIKINSNGDTVYYHNFVLNPSWEPKEFLKINDNRFLIVATRLDTCPNYYLSQASISVSDSLGHLSKTFKYKLSDCKTSGVEFGSFNPDSSIIIGSRNHRIIGTGGLFDFDGKFYVMRIHSSLDSIIWVKQYSDHWGSPVFGKQLTDKSFVVGINMDTAGACLARLDSMGNVLWCKSYFRPKGIITDALVDTDGTIMCVGLTDTIDWGSGGYPPWYSNQLFLMKVDTAGNVIYCKGYNGPSGYYYWRPKNAPLIRKTLDGNFMIGGTKYPYSNNNTIYGLIAMLMKVDGNGDMLWTRGFDVPMRSTQLANFLPVSDGGYLLTGDFYVAISWPFGGCYIYKTDSLGFTSCGNVQELINITPLFPSDSIVSLISINDSASVLNDTIAEYTSPPQTFVDDCIAVGMPQPQQSSSYNIYPNPTKGELKINVTNPLKRDSFVTLYNSIGKIVFQHAIKTEKDLQLDLSKYGKGIYLVKVTEGDKESSSKVVVE